MVKINNQECAHSPKHVLNRRRLAKIRKKSDAVSTERASASEIKPVRGH